MRRLVAFAVGTVVVVAVAVAATIWRDTSLQSTNEPQRVFPALMDEINAVQQVRVESEHGTFRIIRGEAGEWIMPKLADYPVEPDKVKQVLVSMSVLETLEPRTSDPTRHGALGLNDPTASEGGAVSISLVDEAETTLASLLVGRDASGNQRARYVRRAGEDQAWLVWRNFDLPGQPMGWLDSSILDLPRWRVQRFSTEHADGEQVLIERALYSDQYFGLQNIPEGYEPENPYVGNQHGTALERVSAVAIEKRSDLALPMDGPATTVETFDGLRLVVRTAELDEIDWLWVDAEYAPSVRKELPEDGPNIVGLPEMPSLEDVELEVDELNAHLSKWAFAVPPSKRKQFSRRMADLIKEQVAEEAAEEPPAPAN